MKSVIKKLAIVSLSATGMLAASQSYADLIATVPGQASADITLVGDVLTIQLMSLANDPTSAAQLVSGIEFNLSGSQFSSSTATTLNSATGNTAALVKGGDGSYTPSGVGNISPAWGLSGQGDKTSTGTSVNLSVFGGSSPYDMIIGADSAGGFSGTGVDGGKYDNANSSITGMEHEPVVLGTGTFSLTIDGLTSLSQLSGIKIEFGTGPDSTLATTTNVINPVPEPTTVISGALMLVPLSVQLVRKMRQRKQQA